MPGYASEDVEAVFARSRTRFEMMIDKLADPLTGRQAHADLEEELEREQRELTRTMLQDHFDLRAVREERRRVVVGADEVARTRVEAGHQRSLMTVFGPVTVERMAYRALRSGNLYPADAVLNLPTEKHSHGLRKLAAIESARGSFAEAAAAIRRATGVMVGKRQVEQLAQVAAVDIKAFYAARRPEPAAAEHALVLTADGKGIVMRAEALREATARAARNTDRKLASRLSPGEKLGRKRMAEVGGVYDCLPVPRTPDGIMTKGGQKPQAGPVAAGKWLIASITDSTARVISTVFDEAERRDPAHLRTWVALVDGNNHQLDVIGAEAARREVSVTIVIDFIHVLGYLWKAAWTFFYPGDSDAEAWVANQARKILEGKSAQVAAGIRRRATRDGFSTAERKGADACADYLTAKKPHLDYATALTCGWPIATGIIEGACRYLVKDRMDITGARWGLAGAEAVLKLRALITNGDFAEYWAFHLQQEHERVHRIRYRRHRDDLTLAA